MPQLRSAFRSIDAGIREPPACTQAKKRLLSFHNQVFTNLGPDVFCRMRSDHRHKGNLSALPTGLPGLAVGAGQSEFAIRHVIGHEGAGMRMLYVTLPGLPCCLYYPKFVILCNELVHIWRRDI